MEFETLSGDTVYIEPEAIVYLAGFGTDCTNAFVKGANVAVMLKGTVHEVATFVRRAVEFNG